MRGLLAILAGVALAAAQPPAPQDLTARLRRAAEVASVFRREAPNYTGVEVLRQRALVSHWKFGHRQPEVKLQTRLIVSEYGYSTLGEAPDALREFRKVVSVDDRPVTARLKARETLLAGITSRDDRVKQQMLRDFAAYGLEGAISDFGQVLALFHATRLETFEFKPLGLARLGPSSVIRLAYREREGSALTVFEGHHAVHQRLEGELWLLEEDSTPARVIVVSARKPDSRSQVRDETTVDYALNAAGVTLPASVVHRQWVNGELTLEDLFEYSGFRRFSADAVIKFDPDPLPQ